MPSGPYDPMDQGYDWNDSGYGRSNAPIEDSGFWDGLAKAMPWIVGGGMGLGVAQAAAPLFGAGAGAGGAAAEAGGTGSSVGGAGIGASAAGAGSTAAGVGSTAAGAGMNYGKMFGKLDPTTMILGALSLLGGDDGQKRQSYTGQMTSPENTLHQALEAASRLGQGLAERKPTRLRGIADAPKPIQIPGLPFQIGGGLGTDPAAAYTGDMFETGVQSYDPFQSLAKRGQPPQKPKEGGI